MVDSSANDVTVTDFMVLRAVVKYSLCIIAIPVFSFFLVKALIFDGLFALDTITSNVYSAVVAVVVLHVALGLYIHRAYVEAEKPSKTKPVAKVD